MLRSAGYWGHREFVKHKLNVYPMADLVSHHPHSGTEFNGIAGLRMKAEGYVVIRVQVEGVAGYDADQVALVFMHQSPFEKKVPILLGTPAIDRIINVMREDEIDHLAVPWQRARVMSMVRVRVVQLAQDADEEYGEDSIANWPVYPDMFEEVAKAASDIVL